MSTAGPASRAGILALWALVTLFLFRPEGIFGESADPAESLVPIFDPAEIDRIAEEMRLAEKNLSLPPGYVFWKEIVATVTAYEPSRISCGPYADGKTSLGDNAWHLDGVAADPKAIPYRTVVWIPEVGLREVDDTGSAMRHSWSRSQTYHIDLRMTYPYEARRWGVKLLPVRLYRPASEIAAEADRR